jgi:putative CocE/NonD family hydrolase
MRKKSSKPNRSRKAKGLKLRKARGRKLIVALATLPFLPRLAAWLVSVEGERKGYRVEQFKLAARDGTLLSAALYVPKGEGPFPAVIMVHSWMLSRWQCHLYAPYFASAGYLVLAYDCRGWGSSQGQVHCADPQYEINDLVDAIDWLVDASDLPLKDGALGVTGISYGGGHSYLIASRDPRVGAVVPMNGWTDLKESLTPQGSLKVVWGMALLLSASWATKLNPANVLYKWVSTLLFRREDHQAYRAYEEDMRSRSSLDQVGEVSCPMLIVTAWNDELFEPNQIMKYFQELDAPKMLYISNGIHGLDPGLGPRLWGKDIWELTRRWFDYWLRGEENGILSEPAVRLYSPWRQSMIEEPEWPPPDMEMHKMYLWKNNGDYKISSRHAGERGSTTLKPSLLSLATSGPTLVRPQAFGLNMPGTRREAGEGFFSFTTSPSKRDYELLGIPNLRLVLRPLGSRAQINALLYDVPPEGLPRLITHGTMTLEDPNPGEETAVSMDLIARDYLIEKGNRIRLTLSGSNFPFALPVPGEGVEIFYGDGESALHLPLRKVSAG